MVGVLKEAVPGVKRIGVLSYPIRAADLKKAELREYLEAAARSVGHGRLAAVAATSEIERRGPFARRLRSADATLLITRPWFCILVHRRSASLELAAQHRLPAMYGSRLHAEVGLNDLRPQRERQRCGVPQAMSIVSSRAQAPPICRSRADQIRAGRST